MDGSTQGVGVGLASRWGWIVARGVVGVLFGLIAFARPGAVAIGMVLLFGCYAFAGGLAMVVASARTGRAGGSWGTLLVEGLLSIAIGVLAVVSPGTMALTFVWLIGCWAIVTGALEIASAIRLRKIIEHEWALGLAGLLSVAFGLLLLYRPITGGLAVTWWLGGYALFFGALMIVFGFHLRSFARSAQRGGFPSEGLRQT